MKRILLIEDDDLMMKIILRILSKENYQIITASNGKEAFQKLEEEAYNYDLVITDIMMPYASGFEVVTKIKEHTAGKKKIPVIIISNVNHEDTVLEVFKVGADDYLKKPVMAGELLIRVKRLLF